MSSLVVPQKDLSHGFGKQKNETPKETAAQDPSGKTEKQSPPPEEGEQERVIGVTAAGPKAMTAFLPCFTWKIGSVETVMSLPGSHDAVRRSDTSPSKGASLDLASIEQQSCWLHPLAS